MQTNQTNQFNQGSKGSIYTCMCIYTCTKQIYVWIRESLGGHMSPAEWLVDIPHKGPVRFMQIAIFIMSSESKCIKNLHGSKRYVRYT